jgi:3-methylfumaryl-CoA hydratase
MATGTPAATLDDLERFIGVEHGFRGVDDVSLNDIRRKLEVYCFACPLYYDDETARAHGYRGIVAPVTLTPLWAMPAYWNPGEPTFYVPGVREKTGGIRTELPTVYPKGVNTATDWEYFEPLYPGDGLEGNWRLIEIKPRQTRLGDGVFLTTETTIFKRSGELVAKNRNTGFRYHEKTGDGPREKRGERTSEVFGSEPSDATKPENVSDPMDWSVQRRLSDVAAGHVVPDLSMWLTYQRIVMSVAVDRMFSGIHHNRDQAQGSGFNDIIFNTRSYEMLFELMLRRWAGLDGRICKLGPFRMSGSSYPGDVVTARARVTGIERQTGESRVKLEIVVVNDRGEAARGEAEVALPA